MSAKVHASSGMSLSARYEALFAISRALSGNGDCKQLFNVLGKELRNVISSDLVVVVLYDESSNHAEPHTIEVLNCPSIPLLTEVPTEDTLSWWVHENQRPLIIPFVEIETRFPRVMDFLKKHGIQSACVLPLRTAHRRLGSFVCGSLFRDAHAEDEVRFLSLVADQLALMIDDRLNFQASLDARAELQREKDRLKVLLDLNNTVVSNLDLLDLLRAISASVRSVMNCDGVGIALPDPKTQELQMYALDFPHSKGFVEEGCELTRDSAAARVFETGKPLSLNDDDVARHEIAVAEGIKSLCLLPLVGRNGPLGVLSLARRQEDAFTDDAIDFLTKIANQIAIAVENALAYREIADLKDQLAQEKLYLEDEIRTERGFEEIVGHSPSLRKVLREIETVAATESTVLIYGETGSGKELIARAIHTLSNRRQNAFVKLNCAAIPTGLLESELFGHEKGAFTGAINQQIGRFELANHGTVFLDEIGEIPLELQPKLLRVLQERAFERLGSSRTLRTDARLIAATNRDLQKMVNDEKFRSDLFYRLNVFPVRVPPLRERTEDIPLLVRHFVQQFSRRMNKMIDTIPAEAMTALMRYEWPGNIREMQNFIERAVILSSGHTLQVPLSDFRAEAPTAIPNATDTLEQAERKHITKVLEETKWVVAGPRGAALRLGMKRSTLQLRMKKLGILRPAK